MSYSQAAADVRFYNNDGDDGVVSRTISSEHIFDRIRIPRQRNAKSTEDTNSFASNGCIRKNIPQGHAKRSSKYSTKWESKRQEYTNVPREDAENKALGRWVHTQRTQYKLLKENRKNQMTRERIQSLDELDFE